MTVSLDLTPALSNRWKGWNRSEQMSSINSRTSIHQLGLGQGACTAIAQGSFARLWLARAAGVRERAQCDHGSDVQAASRIVGVADMLADHRHRRVGAKVESGNGQPGPVEPPPRCVAGDRAALSFADQVGPATARACSLQSRRSAGGRGRHRPISGIRGRDLVAPKRSVVSVARSP